MADEDSKTKESRMQGDGKEQESEEEEVAVKPKVRQRRSKKKSSAALLRANPLELCESAMEKLKILDYEKLFCEKLSRKPFSRTFFALEPVPPENASTQLATFLELVSWLMEMNGRDFLIDKFDDPTTSVNKVMVDLKQMEFEMNFPAQKLRQGHGSAICLVLNFLIDRALSRREFSFKDVKPEYPEELDDNADVHEEADVGAIDDDIAESSEEEILYTQMVQQNSEKKKRENARRSVLKTNTDEIKWKAELERVSARLSKLSRFVEPAVEWRTHLVQAKENNDTIRTTFPHTSASLRSVEKSIQLTLERIVSKEKYINGHFDNMQYKFQELKQKYEDTKSRCQVSQDSVRELSEVLSTLAEKLEELKESQESRGSSMTDTGPLVRMKKAMKKLKGEIKEMEIRIGVLSHTLMQAKMREHVTHDFDQRDEDNFGRSDTKDPDSSEDESDTSEESGDISP